MVLFKATNMSRLTATGGWRSGGRADILLVDDGKNLLVNLFRKRGQSEEMGTGDSPLFILDHSLELPIANIAKMEPRNPHATTAYVILTVHEMIDAAQIKISLPNSEEAAKFYEFMVGLVGIRQRGEESKEKSVSPMSTWQTARKEPRKRSSLVSPLNFSPEEGVEKKKPRSAGREDSERVLTETTPLRGWMPGEAYLEKKRFHLDDAFHVVISRVTAMGESIPPEIVLLSLKNGKFELQFADDATINIPVKYVERLPQVTKDPLLKSFCVEVMCMGEISTMDLIFPDNQKMMEVHDFMGSIVGIESSPPIHRHKA